MSRQRGVRAIVHTGNRLNRTAALTLTLSQRERGFSSLALALAISLSLTNSVPVAYAHEGVPPQPHDLPTAWSWEPSILLSLALGGWLYRRGVRALWQRAGRGRGVERWRAAAFGAGLLVLFVALVSPLDALGAALFSAHMVQHMLLVVVAAPLLVLGAPQTALFWALAEPRRRALGGWWRGSTVLRTGWRGLSHPLAVWLLHAAALWLWHLPGPYQAALTREVVHLAEHASFLGTALLFWWILIGGSPRERLNPALGVLYLFSFALQGGILGALMTFAPSPWYPAYGATVTAWGLTALEDQQLAGLIMWVPAGLVYLAAALIPLAALLGSEDESLRPPERRLERPL